MSETDFTAASEEMKTWKPDNREMRSPSNEEKLRLYASFKQATVGAFWRTGGRLFKKRLFLLQMGARSFKNHLFLLQAGVVSFALSH
jgi:hypothetical protein